MSGQKILLVDADSASLGYVARQLTEAGYHVLQAPSGKKGLIAAWRDRPDVIIVDPALPDVPAEEFAQKLRKDVRTAAVPLIALSSLTDPQRGEALLQTGFHNYIQKSKQAIPDVLAALKALSTSSEHMEAPAESINPPTAPAPKPASLPAPSGSGLSVVFLSAKGGTGTSSLCANLAMNIAVNHPDERVALVDLVLPIGSLSALVGHSGAIDLVEVADMSPDRITPEYFRNSMKPLPEWHVHLLEGCPNPDCSQRLNIASVPKIIAALQGAFDFVVIDIGRALSRITLPLIQRADLIVLIVSTDLATIANTRTVWEYLRAHGVDPEKMYTILNRAVGLEGVTKTEAEGMIGLTIHVAVPHLGGNFALANNLHKPLSLKFPNDTAAIVLKDAATQMVSQAKRVRG
jgi:Flp pilus assembly CpaE family ATPase